MGPDWNLKLCKILEGKMENDHDCQQAHQKKILQTELDLCYCFTTCFTFDRLKHVRNAKLGSSCSIYIYICKYVYIYIYIYCILYIYRLIVYIYIYYILYVIYYILYIVYYILYIIYHIYYIILYYIISYHIISYHIILYYIIYIPIWSTNFYTSFKTSKPNSSIGAWIVPLKSLQCLRGVTGYLAEMFNDV